LGVAGVGAVPDEEVARAEHSGLGNPRHGRVIGLAFFVAQAKLCRSHGELVLEVVCLVGVAIFARPLEIRYRELASIDDLVVARGHDVTVEASG